MKAFLLAAVILVVRSLPMDEDRKRTYQRSESSMVSPFSNLQDLSWVGDTPSDQEAAEQEVTELPFSPRQVSDDDRFKPNDAPFQLPELPDPVSTYPEMFLSRKKVLVVDLDETIYYCKNMRQADESIARGNGLKIITMTTHPKCVLYLRPGAREFLERMSEYYEIASFTKGIKEYADKALAALSLNNVIKPDRILYRDSFSEGKDLRKFGFNLRDIVLLDDNYFENFKPNSVEVNGDAYGTNGITISEFKVRSNVDSEPMGLMATKTYWDESYVITEDQKTESIQELNEISEFLIAISNEEDVRQPLLERAYKKGEKLHVLPSLTQ